VEEKGKDREIRRMGTAPKWRQVGEISAHVHPIFKSIGTKTDSDSGPRPAGLLRNRQSPEVSLCAISPWSHAFADVSAAIPLSDVTEIGDTIVSPVAEVRDFDRFGLVAQKTESVGSTASVGTVICASCARNKIKVFVLFVDRGDNKEFQSFCRA